MSPTFAPTATDCGHEAALDAEEHLGVALPADEAFGEERAPRKFVRAFGFDSDACFAPPREGDIGISDATDMRLSSSPPIPPPLGPRDDDLPPWELPRLIAEEALMRDKSSCIARSRACASKDAPNDAQGEGVFASPDS